MPTITLETNLPQSDVNEIVSAVYRRRSESFDTRRKAKDLTWESAHKFCPKGEWPQYHARMVKESEAEFAKWDRLFNDIRHWARYDV